VIYTNNGDHDIKYNVTQLLTVDGWIELELLPIFELFEVQMKNAQRTF
jgi:hypothetical protein